MRISYCIFAIAIVSLLGIALATPIERSSTCTDDKKLRFKIKKKKRSCKWASKKHKKRCRKKSNDGTKVKVLCPAACKNCPEVEPTPVANPTIAPVVPTAAPVNPTTAPISSGSGCCSLNYKECIDWCGTTEDECTNCSNSEVGWLSDGAPTDQTCGERWQGCGDFTSGHSGCCPGLTCQEENGWTSCTPGDDNSNPTSPPASSPTDEPVSEPEPTPVANPTIAPVVPTAAPVNPTTAPISSGSGCCSLNYKECIDWCGTTEDECTNCSNSEVGWLPDGAPTDQTCGERWQGCGDFTSGHSGCCPGLTCQEENGWTSCTPGDDNSNPTSPPASSPTDEPVSEPEPTPVANPTIAPVVPTAAPVNPTIAPVSAPSDDGDLTIGKATFYGGNEAGGACGYNDLPKVTFPFGFSAAIGGDEFDDGYGCGACYEITCVGPSGNNPDCSCGDAGQNTVIVQATDQCPECDSTHFDLNTEAFTSFVKDQSSSMAGTCGVVETTFRRISCDFTNNIKIRSKSGTSGWWYGLHIDDVAGYGAIYSIKLREAGRRENGEESFDIVCDKSQGASFWYCIRPNGREIFAPLDVHLTDSAGRTLERNNVITDLGGGLEFDFGTNYGPIDGDDPSPTPPVSQPTPSPTNGPDPTTAPVNPPQPTPPFSNELLTTDTGMNAWEVFAGVDSLTYKNSVDPPNYAYVSSGGVAGDGDVVSEGQAYGLLITGAILASWDTHAGTITGSDRSKVLDYFEGYYNFWKDMCQNSNDNASCQSNGAYCQSSSGSHNCLPHWKHLKTGGILSTGAAPDADEDAIVGIMLAVKAVENDTNRPSWYDEARKWADASATAFFKFNVDNSKDDYRLVKLGSCWGGWEQNGNNPSYHSPGSYRVMKDYQNSFPDSDRVGYSAISQSEWSKLIDTSYEVLSEVQCGNDGALVPNWATVGVQNGAIVNMGQSFSGSGTPQYEYGSEAARTTFRVALDAAFYPEKASAWSPFLYEFNYRMDEKFQNGSFSSNTFPDCRAPNVNTNTYMFSDWKNNAFIYGPTYSALIASSGFGNADAMIDAAGTILGNALPDSYYPRSWALISNLMLNGAMESAGNTLKG